MSTDCEALVVDNPAPARAFGGAVDGCRRHRGVGNLARQARYSTGSADQALDESNPGTQQNPGDDRLQSITGGAAHRNLRLGDGVATEASCWYNLDPDGEPPANRLGETGEIKKNIAYQVELAGPDEQAIGRIFDSE